MTPAEAPSAVADQPPSPTRRTLERLFGIDPRALVAFRIGLGVLLLVDLATRLPNLVAHYSDLGVLPRQAVEFSPYTLLGSAGWAGFMFALSAALAVLLLVGYRTWFVTLLCWFMLVSLQARNPLVNNSGDHLLALLLFWSLFLPLGGHGSRTRTILSAGSAALLLQLVPVYVCSALLKDKGVWWDEGRGVYLALSTGSLTTDAGRWLLGWPRLVSSLSRMTYGIELVGPFLAFVPRRTAFFRTATAAMFVGFHVALAICFDLSLFPYVCMVAWLPFLPAAVWDALARWSVGPRRAGSTSAAPTLGTTRVAQMFAGVLLIYMLAWNLGTVYPRLDLPSALKSLGRSIYLGQRWGMFAPQPAALDGWWIAPARLQDGTEVDLWSGGPVSRARPGSVLATFPTMRWNKYFENLRQQSAHKGKFADLARWLRWRWDSTHDVSQHVVSLKIISMEELTQPDYRPHVPRESPYYEWESGGAEGSR